MTEAVGNLLTEAPTLQHADNCRRFALWFACNGRLREVGAKCSRHEHHADGWLSLIKWEIHYYYTVESKEESPIRLAVSWPRLVRCSKDSRNTRCCFETHYILVHAL